jgi:hypothetical protein
MEGGSLVAQHGSNGVEYLLFQGGEGMQNLKIPLSNWANLITDFEVSEIVRSHYLFFNCPILISTSLNCDELGLIQKQIYPKSLSHVRVICLDADIQLFC